MEVQISPVGALTEIKEAQGGSSGEMPAIGAVAIRKQYCKKVSVLISWTSKTSINKVTIDNRFMVTFLFVPFFCILTNPFHKVLSSSKNT